MKISGNNYLYQSMGRLISDIIIFLESNGIIGRREVLHGFDVIGVSIADGKTCRTIIPLEISAESIEEALTVKEAASKIIAEFRNHGKQPLIITEDRWRSQRSMMEARLLAHLEIFTSVFARNCIVRKIDKAEAGTFLAANHSYGYAACRHHYGLFNRRDDSLIAVATFSNARKWFKDGAEIRSYEWTRYASLPGLRICGGMGKLLKAFINEVHPDDIMSYADLEWSEGAVYTALGFTREPGRPPVTFTISPDTWERTAIRRSPNADGLFFCNFGSAKYRLKLTDYK